MSIKNVNVGFNAMKQILHEITQQKYQLNQNVDRQSIVSELKDISLTADELLDVVDKTVNLIQTLVRNPTVQLPQVEIAAIIEMNFDQVKAVQSWWLEFRPLITARFSENQRKDKKYLDDWMDAQTETKVASREFDEDGRIINTKSENGHTDAGDTTDELDKVIQSNEEYQSVCMEITKNKDSSEMLGFNCSGADLDQLIENIGKGMDFIDQYIEESQMQDDVKK